MKDAEHANRLQREQFWGELAEQLRSDLADSSDSTESLTNRMRVIWVVGPQGAGVHLAARQLAKELQWDYLEWTKLVRAVTYMAKRAGADLRDYKAVADFARSVEIRFGEGGVVYGDGEDLTKPMMAIDVSTQAHHIADNQSCMEIVHSWLPLLYSGRSAVGSGYAVPHCLDSYIILGISLWNSDRNPMPSSAATQAAQSVGDSATGADWEEKLHVGVLHGREVVQRPFEFRSFPSNEVCTDGKSTEQVIDEMACCVRAVFG